MKILVTGSNGLLGQKITDVCRLRPEIQLIATAKGADRYFPKEGYVFESLDITDEKQVSEAIERHKPDVVINTAAMTNVDTCESDHLGCDDLNINAVKYLVNACNKWGVHLMHISTDFIFDGTHGPLKETEKPNPVSYYGQSKLSGELMVMEKSRNWAILRTVLVYGVVHDMSRSNVVLWVKNNLQQGKEIHVVDDQFRTPTLAEDLAMGCILAAQKRATGIFHIGGPDFLSIYELAEQVADFWSLNRALMHRSKSETINQPAKRPPITGFIIDKAINELGYKPHTFAEGLALVDEQLKHIKV